VSWVVPTIGTAAAGAIGAVGAELASRAWLQNRGRYYVWPPHWRAEIQLDSKGLPWLPPVARWSINSQGERGAEPPTDWSDTARVVVAGGSTTECYFLDQEATWAEQLSGLLNAPGVPQRFGAKQVHVGNIGRSVMDAEFQTTIFEKVLPNYDRLDLVVLFMGNSEAVRWMHLREAAEYPTQQPPTSHLFGAHPEGPFGWKPQTLAARRVVSGLKRRHLNQTDVLERAGKRLAELRQRRAHAAKWIEEMSDPQPLLDHYDESLRGLLALLKTKAKRVLYIAQPWLDRPLDAEEQLRTWNFGFGRPYQEVLDTYYRYDVACQMLNAVRVKGLEVAKQCDVDVYDMGGAVPHDWDHYYDSLHHTPLGNRVVAERIADRILEAVPV
jgi:hypothetical protein